MTPEQVARIRAQVVESRHAQGLDGHITDPNFLDLLARAVLAQDQGGDAAGGGP
jgi:hypothetical protein